MSTSHERAIALTPGAGGRVRMLGEIEIVDQRAVATVIDPATRLAIVLGVLGWHANEVVATEALLEAGWPERPPTARTALHGQIAKLRRLLADGGVDATVVTVGSGYRLEIEERCFDVSAFLAATRRGRAVAGADHAASLASFQVAAGLWGEPFGGAGDGTQLDAARRSLELEMLRAEEAISELELLLRRDDPDMLRRRVDAQPLREVRWEQLARSLYRDSRQAEALRACAEVRDLLRDELGIEPGPALRAVEEQILLQDPVLVRSVRRPTPRFDGAATEFVGRATELDALVRAVERRQLVTIVGTGGVGKTRLVRRLLDRVAGSFPGGVWFVSCVAATDEAEIWAQLRTVTGCVGDPDQIARSLGSAGSALIVLDNCEQVRAASAELALSLVTASPDLHVVATSRSALDVVDEMVVALEPLDVRARLGGEVSDSRRLFDACAAARTGSATTRSCEDDEPIDRICEMTGGLPLAIELVAGRCDAGSPSAVLQLLDRGVDGFGQRADGQANHRSLRDTIEWSVSLLEPTVRETFVALCILRGTFDLAAASAVSGLAETAALESLATLTEASLLGRTEAGRWAVLPPIQRWGRERLAHLDSDGVAANRHFEHFAALAVELGEGLTSPRRGEIVTLVGEVFDDLMAAVGFALDCDDRGRVLQLVPTVIRIAGECGVHPGPLPLEERALQATATEVSRGRGLLLQAASWRALWQRDRKAADALAGECLRLGDELDDDLTRMRGWMSAGNVIGWLDGKPAEAIGAFDAALRLARTLGEATFANALGSVGYMRGYCGDHEGAQEVAGELAELGELFDIDQLRFASRSLRGWSYLLDGELDAAESHLDDQVLMAESIGLLMLLPASQARLAWLYVEQHDHGRAEKLLRMSLDGARRWGAELRLADTTTTLGLLERRRGRFAEAHGWFLASARHTLSTLDRASLAWLLLEEAMLARAVGLDGEAERRSAASAVLRERTGFVPGVTVSAEAGALMEVSGVALEALSDFDVARVAARPMEWR